MCRPSRPKAPQPSEEDKRREEEDRKEAKLRQEQADARIAYQDAQAAYERELANYPQRPELMNPMAPPPPVPVMPSAPPPPVVESGATTPPPESVRSEDSARVRQSSTARQQQQQAARGTRALRIPKNKKDRANYLARYYLSQPKLDNNSSARGGKAATFSNLNIPQSALRGERTMFNIPT